MRSILFSMCFLLSLVVACGAPDDDASDDAGDDEVLGSTESELGSGCLTNKEAREIAAELGYREMSRQYTCKGRPVFCRPHNPRLPNCITPDNTCHGGALWKGLADAKVCDRYISYDRYLTKCLRTT